jgi:hypothetical protein
VSTAGPLPRFILPLPAACFPHTVDRVERPTTAGTDASGVAVPAWDVIYTDLKCLADLHMAGERGTGRGIGGAGDVFGAPAEEVRGAFYFPALPGGGLPDVRRRDRILFGAWPGGVPRYIDVTGAFDAGLFQELVLEVVGVTRKPG